MDEVELTKLVKRLVAHGAGLERLRVDNTKRRYPNNAELHELLEKAAIPDPLTDDEDSDDGEAE